MVAGAGRRTARQGACDVVRGGSAGPGSAGRAFPPAGRSARHVSDRAGKGRDRAPESEPVSQQAAGSQRYAAGEENRGGKGRRSLPTVRSFPPPPCWRPYFLLGASRSAVSGIGTGRGTDRIDEVGRDIITSLPVRPAKQSTSPARGLLRRKADSRPETAVELLPLHGGSKRQDR